MDLSKDPRFEVDRRALDEQWESQPALFLEYAEKLAEVNAEVDRLKDGVEVVRAQLDSRVRKELAASVAKVTEAMVTAAIASDKDMIETLEILREAQKDAAILKAEVQALDQRRSALENLVRLHGQEYYAVPTTTPEDRAQYNKNRANSKVREAMTRKRK
jgi:hypothetical protein